VNEQVESREIRSEPLLDAWSRGSNSIPRLRNSTSHNRKKKKNRQSSSIESGSQSISKEMLPKKAADAGWW
jgi:hypothetical protein